MSGRQDLTRAMRSIMAQERETLGKPPTPEELLAWHDRELSDSQRRRVEAKIAAFPDAAQALVDLAAFPDVRPVPGVAEISDREVGKRWQSFRQLLEEPRPSTAGGNHAAWRLASLWRPLRRLRTWPATLAAGVVFLVGVGVGLTIDLARAPEPAAARNVTISQLSPVAAGGERDAGRTVVELGQEAEGWVLVLALPVDAESPVYEAAILDTRDREAWSAGGLRPTALGTLQLAFPHQLLPPGDYRLVLFVGGDDLRKEVAAYAFRLTGR